MFHFAFRRCYLANQEDKILDLLALLRADFLEQLTQQCFDLEHLVLALASGRDTTVDFDNLFRIIHNLKGAGGTHGVALITSICHLFEDNLSSRRQSQQFEKAFVDQSLQLIDLLRRAGSEKGENTDNIARELDALRQSLRSDQWVVMVLESSKVMAMLLDNAFKGMPVKLTIMTDGMQALSRLLHEPVDAIIASNNIASLSGLAVVSAIKVHAAVNANVPVLFYSSNPNLAVEKNYNVKAFQKSPELAQQLALEVATLRKNKS